MSTDARTESTGPMTAAPAGTAASAAQPPAAAGRLLSRLSVLPVLAAVAWLLAGLPLLLAGHFTAALMLVLALPLTAALVAAGLHWAPGRRPGAAVGRRARARRAPPRNALAPRALAPAVTSQPTLTRLPGAAGTPWWAVAGVLAVAVGFAVDQLIYHSQFIIIMRDPASYFQFGFWLAHHGSLPIPQDRAAFGPSHVGLTYQSLAFYQQGRTVVPQFMAGLPMVLAAAFWIAGPAGALVASPLLGACAVLTFGGLTARLVGARWAPLAALVLALSLPEQFTSRANYSEPLAQILFLGGLCLVVDSLSADGSGGRVLAALGGLAIGLTVLVRIDGLSDILPVIPYCGLLILRRQRQGVPLLAGALTGAALGLVDGFALSRPYLASIQDSLLPLGLAVVAVSALTAAAVAWRWRRGLPESPGRLLPAATAVLAVVVMTGFAIRPYLQTVRGHLPQQFQDTIAGFQRGDHLPVDPQRLYYEISLHWVFWYIGVPAVVLGTLAAVVLSRWWRRGQAPAGALPLVSLCWAIVIALYRPAITPDHPWASRRLVPAVLPGFILLAVWAASWLVTGIRSRGHGRVAGGALAFCCAAALLLPTAATTFGLGVHRGGPAGIRLTATGGTAVTATYIGELAAVDKLCAAIPRDSSVVILSNTIADRFSQIIRGMCGVPAARLDNQPPAAVQRIIASISRGGRRPVLLATLKTSLRRYGGPRLEILNLNTQMDQDTLVNAPTQTSPLGMQVWMSEPRR